MGFSLSKTNERHIFIISDSIQLSSEWKQLNSPSDDRYSFNKKFYSVTHTYERHRISLRGIVLGLLWTIGTLGLALLASKNVRELLTGRQVVQVLQENDSSLNSLMKQVSSFKVFTHANKCLRVEESNNPIFTVRPIKTAVNHQRFPLVIFSV